MQVRILLSVLGLRGPVSFGYSLLFPGRGLFKIFSMGKRKTTFHELYTLVNDMAGQTKRSPAFALFFKGRIQRFRDDNASQIRNLEAKVSNLVKQYVMADENNNALTEVVDGQTQYKFFTVEARDAYLKELNHFLKQETTIVE
jgi:hypothetical protein